VPFAFIILISSASTGWSRMLCASASMPAETSAFASAR